ncbi:MAG: polymerase [Micavibrio sp.]|nr:MAG: polymerase [Micavibrio sp.]
MSISSAPPALPGKNNIYPAALVLTVVLMSIITVFSPRFMAYAPGLVAVIMAAVGFYMAQKPVLPKTALLWVAVIIGLAGLSCFWSIVPDFAVKRTLKMAMVLLPGVLLLGLVLSVDREYIKRFLWLLPACIIVTAFVNCIELFFDMPVYRFVRGLDSEAIIGRSGSNRGVFCTVATFFVCIPVILKQDNWKHYRYLALAILSGLVVLMLSFSESQSSQLCFAVGLLFFLAFPYRVKAAWIFIALVLTLLILTAPWIVQIMFKTLPAHVGSLESGSWLANGYAAHRMEIWDFIGRYILQNPLYGYGIEATRHIEDFDTQMLYHPDNMILHPHNFALQLWIEFGLIGAVMGCLFLTHLIYRIYQMPSGAGRIALPTLFSFLSVAATGYGMWQGWWLGECILMLSLSTLVIRAYHK